jgi:hypothetical protein
MLVQLNPSIPMHVVENPDGFPVGNGLAIFLESDGLEHHVLWAVAYDDGGSVYWVPNPFVRLQSNPSAGRRVGGKAC